MRMLTYGKIALCAGLLGACCMGCGKGAEQAPQAAASSPAAAPHAAGSAEEADPVTRLALKYGLPADKVAAILAIYEKNAGGADSGRDVYNIALLGSRATGVPTDEVGSVILAYRSLADGGVLKAAATPKTEAPKG